MYNKRRYNRYKRRYRPKYRKGYGYSLKKLNSKINRVAKAAQPELKNWDTDATVTPNATATTTNLTAIPQGSTSITRDGDKVVIKSLQAKIFYDLTNTVGDQILVRCVIVKGNFNDKTEAMPVYNGDLYDSNTINAFRTIQANDPKKYTVLYDKIIVLRNDGDAQINNTKVINYYKRMNVPCHFEGSGTIPKKGGLYMLFLAPKMSAAVTLEINVKTRVRYTDS